MSIRKVISVGEDAIRIEGDNIPELRLLGRALRTSSVFVEVVDGTGSVTVLFDTRSTSPDQARCEIDQTVSSLKPDSLSSELACRLSVRFGGSAGPDFDEVCSTLGLAGPDLIQDMLKAQLSVDMLGFVPGFAYISGLPPRLDVPRRQTPRQTVRAGSLGIAAGRLGTYALDGPGGWSIIGRITTPLFMPNAADPFLLKPGMKVLLETDSQT